MNKYNIEVSYQTGDSFGSEDTTTIVEGEWTDLECAKTSLRYIKEHYKMCQEIDDWRRTKTKEQIIDKYKREPWFTKDSPEFGITLVLDGNKPWRYSCSWTGYFEVLHGAEIIGIGDTETSFTI